MLALAQRLSACEKELAIAKAAHRPLELALDQVKQEKAVLVSAIFTSIRFLVCPAGFPRIGSGSCISGDPVTPMGFLELRGCSYVY